MINTREEIYDVNDNADDDDDDDDVMIDIYDDICSI